MLAVIEHLNPVNLVVLFSEAYRTLDAGGLVILTTPASWSDGLLRFLAKLNLVSSDEIDEHIYAYTLPLLGWYFGKAGFDMEKVKFGYFVYIQYVGYSRTVMVSGCRYSHIHPQDLEQ